MFDKIVVATDLSFASEDVLRCVKGLKQLGTKKAILVHAVGAQYVETIEHDMTYQPRLNKQKAILEAQGLEVETILAPSVPAFEIDRIARENKASLIVAGTHGVSLAKEMLIGETLMDIIRHTAIPVLVMQPQTAEGRKSDRYEAACDNLGQHILYCTDFSDTAERAFLFVQQIVASRANSVTLMHVQNKKHLGEKLADRLDEFNQIDEGRLQGLKARLQKDCEVNVQIRLSYGHPAEDILHAVNEDTNYSLIVLGSQGRGFLEEVFLGSVSHAVVRSAPIPVLLVPAVR